MSVRLIGSGCKPLERDPRALARFIEAWNAGVELGALARRFDVARSTCLLLAKRLRDRGQPVRVRRGGTV